MKTKTSTRKASKTTNDRVTGRELAVLADAAPSTICTWTKLGLLQRGKDRRYDRQKSLEAIARHEEERASDGSAAAGARGELGKLRAELLRQRIRAAKLENDLASMKVHDKAACCESLTQILSATSHELHQIGQLVSQKFPEVGIKLKGAIDAEVDERIRRLKEGLAYRGTYYCPSCNHVIDVCRVEPLAEDITP